MRPSTPKLIFALGCGLALLAPSWPAFAQSVGYVTGFPGKDPAGDDEIGWGPAYRPETSFSQPGTPPTPGDFAGAAYRARTGHGPYDAVQDTRGTRPIGFQPDGPALAASRRVGRAHRAVGHPVAHRLYTRAGAARHALR